jgi:hypothetical protein
MVGRTVRHLLQIAIIVMAFLPDVPAVAQSAPRSVLIIDQSEPNSQWGISFRAALRSVLSADQTAHINIYSEIIDLARFNGKQYEASLRDYLREKYRDKPISAIICHGSMALEVLLHIRADL